MIQTVNGKTPEKPVSAYVHPTAIVIGDVSLGEGSSVWPGAVVRGDMAHIGIGKRTNIQDGCVLHTGKFKLSIGEGVAVGHNAVLHSCQIGSGTLVGSGAIVMDASQIGENCIIGAGTLITGGKVIPERSLVVGNPCQIVREVTEEEIQNTSEICGKYVELAKSYIRTGVMR